MAPTSQIPAISVQHLNKSFGKEQVLQDLNLTVTPGSIHGLLGANGSGKTTLVNLISTLYRPDSGTILVNGYDTQHEGARVRETISLTGQFAALEQRLTTRENLMLFGQLQGLKRKEAKQRVAEALELFELEKHADSKAADLSGGLLRRLDIACSIMTPTSLLILDEPTTGLDPRSRRGVWDIIQRLQDSGTTILLTSQYLDEVDILSDRISVLKDGQIAVEGTAEELKNLAGHALARLLLGSVEDVHTAAQALASYQPEVDVETRTITVTCAELGRDLPRILETLSTVRLELDDLRIERPSLDDAFLQIIESQVGVNQ